MNALLQPPAPVAPVRRPAPNLILHCGARAVSREDVVTVPTPGATSSWTPIPHINLVSHVENTISSNGLVVGTLYGGKLAHAGHHVTVVARGRRLLDIRQHGLVLGLLRAAGV